MTAILGCFINISYCCGSIVNRNLKNPVEQSIKAWFSNKILKNVYNIHVAFEEVASPRFEATSSRTT